MCSLKPKDDRDETTGAVNVDGTLRQRTDAGDDGNLKPTEDSIALRNAILGPPQSMETEPIATTDSIPTVHSTKSEPISSGELIRILARRFFPKLIKSCMYNFTQLPKVGGLIP